MAKPEIEIELVYTHFGAIGQEMKAKLDQVCERFANLILADARLAIMNPPKSGRIYRRGKRAHQASAPGEAPATDYGWLANASAVAEDDIANYAVIFFAEYAQRLEYGTPGGKILPRPFLRPAVEKYRQAFEAAMAQAMREAGL